ncbi:MAG: type II CAAX prenyl endopeptidase Rce1 family protein [Planctomycetaceae bacterium]
MSAGLLDSTLLDDFTPAPVYWHEARRPLPTLFFVLPFLLAYELGLSWFGLQPDLLRNGADVWMRDWMLDAGLPVAWILPGLLLCGLLVWQLLGTYPWRVSFDTLTGMFGESLLFAVLLVIGGQSLNTQFHVQGFETLATTTAGEPQPAARALSFLGAGLYEETLFRLALIPFLFYALRVLLIPRTISIVVAVIGSSLIFATAHYLDPQAGLSLSSLLAAFHRVSQDTALWYGFTFRLLAGLSFALLLLFRGFGVTVGSHALYDLLAGILMQAPLAA